MPSLWCLDAQPLVVAWCVRPMLERSTLAPIRMASMTPHAILLIPEGHEALLAEGPCGAIEPDARVTGDERSPHATGMEADTGRADV